MMYWLAAGVAGILLGVGILLLKKVFFYLSESTLGLLDAMLESELDDSQKQKGLIKNLGKVLSSLFLFVLQIFATVVVSAFPLLLYSGLDFQEFQSSHWGGWQFWVALSAGSIVPFVIASFKKQTGDYSPISKLLHRLLLNNYNVSRMLFKMEKKSIVKEDLPANKEFVIVSGLARCGTTGITTKLYESGIFNSLSYSNLPFLLSPNLWKKFYKPDGAPKKERAHGDKVMFGLDTVEALEEFFYKAFLKDCFIHEGTLTEHEITEDIYQEYLTYQQLVQSAQGDDANVYLAKNNNFLLRYNSLRKLNDKFYALVLFRDPLNHAYSLMKQHVRFTQQQQDDSFVLEYMNWLGHHEFGENQKVFQFGAEVPEIGYGKGDINYWLEVWINYYSYLLNLPQHDNTLLIDYDDFLNSPEELLSAISKHTGYDLQKVKTDSFENTNRYTGDFDSDLLAKAESIYSKLKEQKLTPSPIESV